MLLELSKEDRDTLMNPDFFQYSREEWAVIRLFITDVVWFTQVKVMNRPNV